MQTNWRGIPGVWPLLIVLVAMLAPGGGLVASSVSQLETPEQEEIDAIIAERPAPDGILFVIGDEDHEALDWIMPRVLLYVSQIRSRHPDLSIAVLSHGDEMLALLESQAGNHPDVHTALAKLAEMDVIFHVCGSFASLNHIDPGDFAPLVDVVPFAPDQIRDYQSLGFRVVSVEMTW